MQCLRRRTLGVAVLGLAFLAWTPGAIGAAATSGQGQGTFTLEPGQQYHPLPAALAAADAIAFDWKVTDPPGASLYFSQHIHVGQQQLNLSEDTAPAMKDRLVADRDGLFSILWENRGSEAVTFGYEYHTVRAQGAPAATPLPEGLAVAALILGALAVAACRKVR